MKTAVWLLVFLFLSPAAAFSQKPPTKGEYRTYYASGELKSQVTYSSGKKHGIEQIFDKNGKILREYYYQNGERKGEVVPEPERNFGTMRFVKSAPFWVILLTGAVTIWLVISKVLLKKRPF